MTPHRELDELRIHLRELAGEGTPVDSDALAASVRARTPGRPSRPRWAVAPAAAAAALLVTGGVVTASLAGRGTGPPVDRAGADDHGVASPRWRPVVDGGGPGDRCA